MKGTPGILGSIGANGQRGLLGQTGAMGDPVRANQSQELSLYIFIDTTKCSEVFSLLRKLYS